ncbi:hypothetical protein GWI33_001161, partial [Rhynchophorus ferrugineus]
MRRRLVTCASQVGHLIYYLCDSGYSMQRPGERAGEAGFVLKGDSDTRTPLQDDGGCRLMFGIIATRPG